MIGAGRRLLAAAAYGSTGVALTGTALVGLLVTEAKLARHWVGKPMTQPPEADGLYGSANASGAGGRAISFAVLGDSMAAGCGASSAGETPGARIAAGLAERAGTPVRLTNVALVGAQSSDLARQVSLALAARPDVALLMIGANDVTHRIQPSLACAQLEGAVRRLREAGCEVVVGTCPDLGTVEPIARPLRYLVQRWSRQLAAAQTIVVVEAGGRTVSLGDLCCPTFVAAPREMFSADRFHPSAMGYASAAMALLPSIAAAIGIVPTGEVELNPAREEEMLPVSLAAVEAAERPGTEVAPATPPAARDGHRGPWALLRHRRRSELPEQTRSETAGDTAVDTAASHAA